MSGFMRLVVYRAKFADYAPAEGGFAEIRECDTVDDEENLQIVSDVSEGWFARYSAPGYMDQTDSVGPCETASEAAQEAYDLFGDEESDSDRNELEETIRQIKIAGES